MEGHSLYTFPIVTTRVVIFSRFECLSCCCVGHLCYFGFAEPWILLQLRENRPMSPDHNRSSSVHQRVKRTIWVNQCSEPQRDLLMQDSMVYMYELIWREWVTSSNRGTSCVRQTPPTFLRAVDQYGAVKVATPGDGNNLPCSRVIIVATQPQPTFGRLSHTTDKLVCGMSTYPNVGGREENNASR